MEGVCNSSKLIDIEDKLELRFMDELLSIEHYIGEVAAVIGLQFEQELEYIREDQIQYEKFPEPPPVQEKPKPAEGEEEEEEQPPPEDEEEGETKKPAFKPEDYQWTVSNRKPKNLPQLFILKKGINTLHEFKN